MNIPSLLRLRAAGLLVVLAVVSGTQAPASAAAPCPRNMKGYEHLKPDQPLNCSCPPGAPRGPVWGTNRYTSDSSVCGAARHSGAVGPDGGEVKVYVGPGCQRFQGTERAGLRTMSYGRYAATFAFTSPMPDCAEQGSGGPADAAQKDPAAPTQKSFVTSFSVTSSKIVGIGANFAFGVRRVTARYEWKSAPTGYRLGVKWYKGSQLVLTQGEPVASANGATGWFLKMRQDAPLPVGDYAVVLQEAGRPTVRLPFRIVPK
jgi:LCCL domain